MLAFVNLACLLLHARTLRRAHCSACLQVKAHPFFAAVNWETLANDEVRGEDALCLPRVSPGLWGDCKPT